MWSLSWLGNGEADFTRFWLDEVCTRINGPLTLLDINIPLKSIQMLVEHCESMKTRTQYHPSGIGSIVG